MYERFKGDLEEASKNKSISRSWTKEKRQGHDAYVEVNPIQSKQFHHGNRGFAVSPILTANPGLLSAKSLP
jgi:hypothetical protein